MTNVQCLSGIEVFANGSIIVPSGEADFTLLVTSFLAVFGNDSDFWMVNTFRFAKGGFTVFLAADVLAGLEVSRHHAHLLSILAGTDTMKWMDGVAFGKVRNAYLAIPDRENLTSDELLMKVGHWHPFF